MRSETNIRRIWLRLLLAWGVLLVSSYAPALAPGNKPLPCTPDSASLVLAAWKAGVEIPVPGLADTLPPKFPTWKQRAKASQTFSTFAFVFPRSTGQLRPTLCTPMVPPEWFPNGLSGVFERVGYVRLFQKG